MATTKRTTARELEIGDRCILTKELDLWHGGAPAGKVEKGTTVYVEAKPGNTVHFSDAAENGKILFGLLREMVPEYIQKIAQPEPQ
jgi:hypothetical protein